MRENIESKWPITENLLKNYLANLNPREWIQAWSFIPYLAVAMSVLDYHGCWNGRMNTTP